MERKNYPKSLPQYVYDQLERQEKTIERLRAELTERGQIQYAGDLSWTYPSGVQLHDNIQLQPQGTRFYFKQGNRGYISIRQLNHDMNDLEIMSMTNRLIIRPEVSNVIKIRMEDRNE